MRKRRNASIVRANHERAQHAPGDTRRDGLEHLEREGRPIADRRRRDGDARALVDLALSVEGERVLKLADDNMREQRGARTPAIHHLLAVGDDHAVTARAETVTPPHRVRN